MYNAKNNEDTQRTQVINTEEIKQQLKQEEKNIEQANRSAENKAEIKDANTSIGNILTDLARIRANMQDEIDLADEIYVNDNVDVNKKVEELNNLKVAESFDTMYERTFGKIPASTEEKIEEDKKKIDAYDLIKDNNISVFEEVEEYKKPVYKFIGIAFSTYIIIEIKDEMYIIDQHAAHERIMYEKIRKNYYSESDKESQLLLLPDVITLTHKEMDIAGDNMEVIYLYLTIFPLVILIICIHFYKRFMQFIYFHIAS